MRGIRRGILCNNVHGKRQPHQELLAHRMPYGRNLPPSVPKPDAHLRGTCAALAPHLRRICCKNVGEYLLHRVGKMLRNLKGDPLVTVDVKRTGGTLKNNALT